MNDKIWDIAILKKENYIYKTERDMLTECLAEIQDSLDDLETNEDVTYVQNVISDCFKEISMLPWNEKIAKEA